MYSIKVTPEFGRGLYATKPIEPFDKICACEIIMLSRKDTEVVNQTALKFYTFRINDFQDCLVLGDGEIFNHDDKANVSYTIKELDGRPIMVFFSTRIIEPGEQLFIDYRADSPGIDVNEYFSAPSVVG